MAAESTDKSKPSGFISLPILRDLVIVLLLIVFGWKLISSELQIDLSQFSFSELLALILSLFSVALSVAFYFKASETSNQFYINSYKFTKEMSEILGRIEAGFGERLRHLDEGYSGIRDKFDSLPRYGETTTKEIEKEKEVVKEREQEQLAVLENLAERAKLAEDEKLELFSKHTKTSKELESARAELRQLLRANNEAFIDGDDHLKPLYYLAKRASKEITENKTILTSDKLRWFYNKIRNDAHHSLINDLRRYGHVDDGDNLTNKAVSIIRRIIREEFS